MYSQYGEDDVAVGLLTRWIDQPGRVLEIGAWHPTDKSNSRLFIERGWEAVLVEPSPKSLADLAREYSVNPKVTIAGFPITCHGGTITMHLTDDALTGESIPAQWKESGGFYGTAVMNSMSMLEFVRQYGGDFQVVSIDAEGTSVDLFNELVNAGPRPRIVILEHDDRHAEIAAISRRANYRTVVGYPEGTNTILEWQGPR